MTSPRRASKLGNLDQETVLSYSLLFFFFSSINRNSYAQIEKQSEAAASRVNFSLELQHAKLRANKKIGRGDSSVLFLVSKTDEEEEQNLKNFGEEDNLFALKVQHPAHPWEYFISYELMKKIPCNLLSSLCAPKSIHVYRDERSVRPFPMF